MKNMLDTSKFFNKTLESTKRRVVLVLMLLFTIVYAGQANAQSKKVTIVTSGMTIIDVMHEIERQTGYMFVYNNKDINLNKVVKIDVANISVASVLETIFKSTDITYQMNGNNILLMTSAQKEQLQDAAKKGQDTHRQIVGTVKDKNGELIIGASIKVKGSRGQGTMTDADGIFKLNVPDNSTIEVSYIGFITQETKVGNRKSFNIVLQEDKKILDEVVVVGYGNQRRVNIA
ncbi:carboxypeptidase-like regulatory domain-containing protein, partial [Hoylesella oralis]|uniref:STN domain-containing protein n=1 Tax=Hoylesella oralis TaxID=28134 RepID=UPI0028E6AC3A